MFGLQRQQVLQVFVSAMQDPGHGDAFVQAAAKNPDQAKFVIERTIARDFPTFAGAPFTEPRAVARLYALGEPRVLFAAMPKNAPIVLPDGG